MGQTQLLNMMDYLVNLNQRLLDLEWAYRLNRTYSGEDLLASAEKPYRGWIRYSTQGVEARLGLQKIFWAGSVFASHLLV